MENELVFQFILSNQGGHIMANTATLKFNVRREVNKSENKRLMREGYLIGNINSKNVPSIPIAILKSEFKSLIKTHGRNGVFRLEGPDKTYDVMVKAIQINPGNYEYHHVDFQNVLLDERVKANVVIKYTGTEFLEAKRLILSRLVDSVPVSGLPHDIPEIVEFDVATLEGGANILVEDLTFAEGIIPEVDGKQLIGSILL